MFTLLRKSSRVRMSKKCPNHPNLSLDCAPGYVVRLDTVAHMPTPGSSSRGARSVGPFDTVTHWRETRVPNSGTGPRKTPIKDDQGTMPFAMEEVEAAQIMYDAFRATKGPDGVVIDTELWSVETDARVEVRVGRSCWPWFIFPHSPQSIAANSIPDANHPQLPPLQEVKGITPHPQAHDHRH